MRRTEVRAIEAAIAEEVQAHVRSAFDGHPDDARRHRGRAEGMRMALNVARRAAPRPDRQPQTQHGRRVSPPGTPPGPRR